MLCLIFLKDDIKIQLLAASALCRDAKWRAIQAEQRHQFAWRGLSNMDPDIQEAIEDLIVRQHQKKKKPKQGREENWGKMKVQHSAISFTLCSWNADLGGH